MERVTDYPRVTFSFSCTVIIYLFKNWYNREEYTRFLINRNFRMKNCNCIEESDEKCFRVILVLLHLLSIWKKKKKPNTVSEKTFKTWENHEIEEHDE